jgi:hypothetical protein
MKRLSKRMTFLLIMSLILLAWPRLSSAADETRLKLLAPERSLEIGDEFTVEVWIEETPAMYGAESHLSYDPETVAVVDADTTKSGVNVHPGTFLDLEQGFELQNQADNERGTIDYAVTLLNPALPVEGSGLFFNITFRVKAARPTTIEVNKSLFGTPNAEAIEHQIENITLQIGSEYETWMMVAAATIVGLLLLLIILVWRQVRQAQQVNSYR